MLDADERLSRYVSAIGGFYRRYSDDILLVVPPGYISEAAEQLNSVLGDLSLTNHQDKMVHSEFRETNSRIIASTPLVYLGFEFDGEAVRLRQRSIARFHQRMTRAIRSSYRAAKVRGDVKLNRRKLNDRHSHLGRRNFISYAIRASEVFYPGEGRKTPIRRQIRRHALLLNSRIAKAECKLARLTNHQWLENAKN